MDESGNTGNIKLTKFNEMNYLTERYFVLGALKLDSNQILILDEKVEELIKNHRIKLKELKSKDLYRKNKKFLIDFFKLLKDLEVEVLVELIDKKYNLSIQIVDNTIRSNLKQKRLHAQWIVENLDDEEYQAFLDASQTKTKESFEIYINDLSEILDRKLAYFLAKTLPPSEKVASPLIRESYKMNLIEEVLRNNQDSVRNGMIALEIKGALKKSCKDYKKYIKKNFTNPHYKFLPIEDKSKNNKNYSHLPHVNCFLNLALRGIPLEKDVEIEFIHDIQKEFDSILEENFKIAITKLKLKHKLKLEFKDSIESKGVQYSDLVAGTVHKVWRDYVIDNNEETEIKELYEALTDVVIINPVVPDSFTRSNKKMQKIINIFSLKEKNNMAEKNLKKFISDNLVLETIENWK